MGLVARKVYSMKQAESIRGKWDKKHAVIDREGMKLSEAEAKGLNANYERSGRYYEVDEAATKVYLASFKKDKK